MTNRNFAEMSKAQLVRELEKLETAERRFAASMEDRDPQRLIHDLHVHQVELEMQNRELREAQGRLEESRSAYADLYDFAPVGYCTLNSEGRIGEINLTGAAFLGAPREELIGKAFSSAVRLENSKSFSAHMKRCMEEKKRVTTEVTLSLGKRGKRVVQLVSDAFEEEGGARAFRTILFDISELKSLENQLRLLSEAGEALASSLSYATTLEAAARLTVPALADLSMLDVLNSEGEVERPVVIFADPKKRGELAEKMKRFAPRPGWQTPQARVIKSGEPMLLSEVSDQLRERMAYDDDHANLLRGADVRSIMVVPLAARGRTLGALTLAATESDRRYSASDLRWAQDLANRAALAMDNALLHAAAQRAIAARDATLAVVAHDLRNPLAVIQIRTQIILQQRAAETDRRAESRKAVDAIHRSAEEMSRLIDDLLDVSSIEAEHLAVERILLPASSIVRDAVETFQIQASEKSLRLASELPAGDRFDIECDPARVHQVFGNLIGNAIKFTPPGGSITIRAEPRAGEAYFSVTDTGRGIPAADLPHVFDRFWQAQKTARMGTGLGLSISKGIVEALGGRIWADSQVGVGSTFHFTLPLAGYALEDPGPVGPAAESHVGRLTEQRPTGWRDPPRIVLVVEDDPDNREALHETLEHAGYDAVLVANGAEALEYLHRAPSPFSIILDLLMPVMDGWAVLVERNRDPELRSIPVIVVSSERDVADKVASAHASYLQKPVLGSRLIDAIEGAAH